MTKEDLLFNLISLYALRISAVLLLFFGLKTLVSFYKYNVRMAEFYRALSMSLSLCAVRRFDISRFKELSKIIRSEKIDFESQARLIPEDLMTFLKEVKGLTEEKKAKGAKEG